MSLHRLFNAKLLVGISLLVLLVVSAACGGEDPTATVAPTAVVPATAAPATVAPTAMAEPTTRPPAETMDKGQLNIALKEIGIFNANPGTAQYPGRSWIQTAGFEGLTTLDIERVMRPQLASEWSFSGDGLVWTIKLQEGVQFHQGYGEMTADDVIYSAHLQARDGARGPPQEGVINWVDGAKALDSRTIELTTKKPQWDVMHWWMTPTGSSAFVISKTQADQKGEEELESNGAGTGPWEIAEAVPGQFMRWTAVEGHWRKTPEFGELVQHEIGEESTRVANFQTGKVDTMAMGFDSIPAVEKVEGTKFMVQRGVGANSIYLLGQFYRGWGTPDQLPYYNPELPWVASDPDLDSEGWEQAKKVRQAMSLAIDRQLIIDTVLGGYASQVPAMWWAPFGGSKTRETFQWESHWKWEYNPERARELLDEAGYPNGFEVTITPAIRGAPGEVEACEALLPMFEEVGIKAEFQRLPYSALSKQYRAHEVNGITCHTSHPFVNPLMGYAQVVKGVNGYDIPWLWEKIDEANATFDEGTRVDLTYDIAEWIWEDVMDIALYYVDFVYPLGPRIDEWTDHLKYADARLMSGLEYVPHRK